MFGWMVLLFTVLPALEIWVFFQIPMSLGAKLLIVLFTGIAGASLARAQGYLVVRQIQEQLAKGAMPANELIEGGIVLFGGALLLTPGFITDAIGFSCLLPPTRKLIAAGLRRFFKGRVQVATGPGFRASHFEMRTGGRIRTSGSMHMGASIGGREPDPKERREARDARDATTGRLDMGAHAGPRVLGPKTIDASFSVVEDDDEPES